MRFYWTMGSMPELQGLPLPQQRRLWRLTQFRTSWMIIGITFAIVFLWPLAVLLVAMLPLPAWLVAVAEVCVLVGGLLLSVFWFRRHQEYTRRTLRKLRERDYGE